MGKTTIAVVKAEPEEFEAIPNHLSWETVGKLEPTEITIKDENLGQLDYNSFTVLDIKASDLLHENEENSFAQPFHLKEFPKVIKPEDKKIYKCKTCKYQGSTPRKLIFHLQRHIREKPHECDKCPFSTLYQGEFLLHTYKHNDRKPYKCSACNYTFMNKPSLTNHMKKYCFYSKEFDTKLIEEELNQSHQSYQCYICQSNFKRKEYLVPHIKRHMTIDKQYKCNFCKFSTRNKPYLTVHMTNGCKRNPLKCSECNRKFLDRKQHESHSCNLERMHHCYNCNYRTIKKAHLRTHMRIHIYKNRPKPYKCKLCSYTTIHERNLKIHRGRHKANFIRMKRTESQTISTLKKFLSNKSSTEQIYKSENTTDEADPHSS